MSTNSYRAVLASLLIILSILLILSGGCVWLSPETAQAASNRQPHETLPSVSEGRLHWIERCQPCHGPDNEGQELTGQLLPNLPPNFRDPHIARKLVSAENFETIRRGRNDTSMLGWEQVMDHGQIWDTTAYLWSLSISAQDVAVGEKHYNTRCIGCHGPEGRGDGAAAPEKIIDFTELSLMVWNSQAMLYDGYLTSPAHADLEQLSGERLWQTLDYVRTFTFAMPPPEVRAPESLPGPHRPR